MDSFETEMLTTVTTTAMMCRCETMMQQMQTNFFGVLNVTNAVLPYLRERMRGTIVIIGSRSAWRNEFAVSISLLGAHHVTQPKISDCVAGCR